MYYVNELYCISDNEDAKLRLSIKESDFFNRLGSNNLFRVIHISEIVVYLIKLGQSTGIPTKIPRDLFSFFIEQGLLEKKMDNIHPPLILESIPEAQREKCELRYSIVMKYWNDFESRIDILEKSTRGTIFKKISDELEINITTISRIFYKFWSRGMSKISLIDCYYKCGGPGVMRMLNSDYQKSGRKKKPIQSINVGEGVRIKMDDFKNIEYAIKKYYYSRQKKTLKKTYRLMLFEKYSKDQIAGYNPELAYYYQVPTYNQFKYWANIILDNIKTTLKREGKNTFLKDKRGLTGNMKSALLGPGSRYEIDSTPLDIYLISDFSNTPFGKANLYLIVDVYSSLITGMHVSVDSPSWRGASLCLLNMAENKVEFCKRYNIDITESHWPSHHLPQTIATDNGEMVSDKSKDFSIFTGVSYRHMPAYRGDCKGTVEQLLRKMNDEIKQNFPGAVYKDAPKDAKKPELEAALRMEEMVKEIIKMVIHHNNSAVRIKEGGKEVKIIPSKRWEKGIRESSGLLSIVTDLEAYKIALMEKDVASIGRKGVKFEGNIYRLNDPDSYLKYSNNSIKIAYDSRDLREIYHIDESGNLIETFQLSIEEYNRDADYTKEERQKRNDEINENNREIDVITLEQDVQQAGEAYAEAQLRQMRLKSNKQNLSKAKISKMKQVNKEEMSHFYSQNESLLLNKDSANKKTENNSKEQQKIKESEINYSRSINERLLNLINKKKDENND